MTAATDHWQAVARKAGLGLALEQFYDDVAFAAASAETAANGVAAPTDPRAEPWPPMWMGTPL